MKYEGFEGDRNSVRINESLLYILYIQWKQLNLIWQRPEPSNLIYPINKTQIILIYVWISTWEVKEEL